MTPTFTWTPKGKAFAERWSTPDAVIALILAEFEQYEITPKNLIFHSVFMGPIEEDRAFVVTKGDNGSLLIDVAIFEESGETLDSGPFQGMTLMMPRGSEDE